MMQVPLNLLCVEPRFPGRLGPVADWLVRKRGYRCRFYYTAAEPHTDYPTTVGHGLEPVHFNAGGVAREASAPWTQQLERGLCYAYGCWEALEQHRPRPVDLVLGRSAGLGSTLFVPVFQPGVPIVNYLDYFFHAHAHDLAEEAGPDTPVAYFHWRRSANSLELLDLENGITPWTGTRWQRDLFPPEYQNDFVVLHDGVDSRRFRPELRTAGTGQARLVAGRLIPAQTRVVTFVAGVLDRLRGFDRFMELANRLMRKRLDLLCLVVGGSPVQRGLDVQFYNQDYRAHILARTPPHDPQRLLFFGRVSQDVVAQVLAASDLHVYPSRPYVVARSLVEGMSARCVILAWDTAPVRELLTHGQTALLVSPDDPEAAERMANAVLDDPAAHRPLGEAAAELVRQRYDQEVTLPALAELFTQLVLRKR